jgi:hypothetical protein
MRFLVEENLILSVISAEIIIMSGEIIYRAVFIGATELDAIKQRHIAPFRRTPWYEFQARLHGHHLREAVEHRFWISRPYRWDCRRWIRRQGLAADRHPCRAQWENSIPCGMHRS